MANNRRYLIHLPYFSEYLFRVITTAPEEAKKNLSQQERIMLATPDAVNKFCANEPFEKLLFIYTKLGFDWTLTLGPTTEAMQDAVENCRYQYDHSLQRLDAVEAISREQVCVISSRDVMTTQQMCAQNCNTLAYKLTYLFQKIKQTSGKVLKRPYDIQVQEAGESAVIMSKVMLEQLNALQFVEQVLALTLNELRVLLALFNKKDGAMNLKEIAAMTQSEGRKLYMGRDVDKLEKKGLVNSDRPKNKKSYGVQVYFMISTKGIQKVGEYHNYIWEKSFGN